MRSIFLIIIIIIMSACSDTALVAIPVSSSSLYDDYFFSTGWSCAATTRVHIPGPSLPSAQPGGVSRGIGNLSRRIPQPIAVYSRWQLRARRIIGGAWIHSPTKVGGSAYDGLSCITVRTAATTEADGRSRAPYHTPHYYYYYYYPVGHPEEGPL